MAMIKIKHKGSFKNTENFFNRALKRNYMTILNRYGQRGVEALAAATPKDSGITSDSWGYEIEQGGGQVSIVWTNHHENQGVNIAILIIYGHGLHNGGYVQGNDFVTPVLQPIMDEMAQQLWREVTK